MQYLTVKQQDIVADFLQLITTYILTLHLIFLFYLPHLRNGARYSLMQVIPFDQRVSVFQSLLQIDKANFFNSDGGGGMLAAIGER